MDERPGYRAEDVGGVDIGARRRSGVPPVGGSATITPPDEAAAVTSNGYRYDRVVDIAGRTVRARVERGMYLNDSLAIAEVLNEQMTWTSLAADAGPEAATRRRVW